MPPKATAAENSTTKDLKDDPETLGQNYIPMFSALSQVARTLWGIDISKSIPMLLPPIIAAKTLYYVCAPLSNAIVRYGTVTVEIGNNDRLFNRLELWMAKRGYRLARTRYHAGTGQKSKFNREISISGVSDTSNESDESNESSSATEKSSQSWSTDDDTNDDAASTMAEETERTVDLVEKAAPRVFVYEGRLFYVDYINHQLENNRAITRDITVTMRIMCLSRDRTVLKKLLKEAQKQSTERKHNVTSVWQKHRDYLAWARSVTKDVRPLSTVVLDEKQKSALIKDIEEYLDPESRLWYANRSIPYRRGYLLHGPPGTGKTSLSVAVAGKFQLDVYTTSLNSSWLSESLLDYMFSQLPHNCIVLLEDIDAAGVTNDRDADNSMSDPSDRVTLSGLLNIIDGVASSEGRILMMTTNHIEHLDAALIRPGRIDMIVTFENASTTTLQEIFESIYTDRPEDRTKDRKRVGKKRTKRKPKKAVFTPKQISDLAARFAAQIPSGEFSPAEIQGYLLNYKSTPEEACEHVAAWVLQTKKEKRQTRRKGTRRR